MSKWAVQTLDDVDDSLLPLPQEEQQAWLDNVMQNMPEGVAVASAMDTLGFDMSKVQEDGSYSVSMAGLMYGEMYGMGLADADGQINMDAVSDFATQSFTEFTDDEKNAMLAAGLVNSTGAEFLTNKDGTPYENTDGGFSSGAFMQNLGDELNGHLLLERPEARMKFMSQMAENLGSEEYSELFDTNLTLDSNVMMQYRAYQRVSEAVKEGTLSQTMIDDFEDSMSRLSQDEPGLAAPTEETKSVLEQGAEDFKQTMSKDGPHLDSAIAGVLRDDAFEDSSITWASYDPEKQASETAEPQQADMESEVQASDGVTDRGAEAEAKFGDILQQADTQAQMEME